MLKCVVKMNDPHIGDYYMCKKCKHFMLTRETAVLHRGCKKTLLKTFTPDEEVYTCKTCGRFFDNQEQFKSHVDMHKRLGNADVSKFEPVKF